MASGRWFRFVGTTVTVPPAGAYGHYARVVLRGQNVSAVTLAIKPGGGPGSVGWAVGVAPFGMGGGAVDIAPAAGDTVRIDLYYDKTGGGVIATATDLTTNATAAQTISEGTTAIFTKAEIGTVLNNPASPPTADSRLWQFTDTGDYHYRRARHGDRPVDHQHGHRHHQRPARRPSGDEPIVPVQQQRQLRRLDP
jgi:hypothetical protein